MPLWSLTFLTAQDCTNFCVWPGDANNNGIANHFDVLQLGIASEATGPFRADENVDWSAKEAVDWNQFFNTNNANYKHADANGDGFADIGDIYAIGDNFNQTNDLYTGAPEGNNIEGPDLTASLNFNSYTDGETVTIDITLGSPENPVENLMGLAFSLDIDTAYVQQVIEPVTWDFGFIGPEEDLFLFDKWEPGISDAIDFSFARNNGVPINGYGRILTVQLVIIDDLSLRFNEPQPYEIKIKDVLGIDPNETDLLITAQGDEATLQVATNVKNLSDSDIKIHPNPFQDVLIIEPSSEEKIEEIKLIDSFGKVVFSQTSPTQKIEILAIPVGMYFLYVKTHKNHYVQKMVKR